MKKMMRFPVLLKNQNGQTADIIGSDFREAVEANFEVIVRAVGGLGNIGYELDSVSAEYVPDILGGRGGIELYIMAHGVEYFPGVPVNKTPKLSTAWVYARPEDLPQPIEFEIFDSRPSSARVD